jgi:hypothetical protein
MYTGNGFCRAKRRTGLEVVLRGPATSPATRELGAACRIAREDHVNTDSSTVHETNVPVQADAKPWQLKLFSKSLKKQQKARLLLKQLRPLRGEQRLLVTNGDNNGALNHYLRASGGQWTWVENEGAGIGQIET